MASTPSTRRQHWSLTVRFSQSYAIAATTAADPFVSPQDDTTEEFKTKVSNERREIYEGLASRAAKLLRAAAYCARAPVALAWDARCDPVEVNALLKGDVAEGLQRAVGLFADENEDAWSLLEQEHPGDATDVLKAYARVAKRASRDLIDASQAPATNEAIVDEDEALAKQSDGDVAKRCREAASEIVGETGRQTTTLQKWHSDLQCVAKHDDDDEPPMRLGGDRAHALGRHQGLGGLTRAGCSGYGLCGNQPVSGAPDNSSLSHVSAMAWPSLARS